MKTKLEIKALQDALIYTKEAFGRIFGVLPKRIIRAQVWWSGYWVIIKGKRPRLYKKSLFEVHFANFRKESARKLVVKPMSLGSFAVENPEAGTVNYPAYNVKDGNVRYECGCRDFCELSEAFKKPACKHIYAVLFSQGFGSIAEAIAQHKAEFQARLAIGI